MKHSKKIYMLSFLTEHYVANEFSRWFYYIPFSGLIKPGRKNMPSFLTVSRANLVVGELGRGDAKWHWFPLGQGYPLPNDLRDVI